MTMTGFDFSKMIDMKTDEDYPDIDYEAAFFEISVELLNTPMMTKVDAMTMATMASLRGIYSKTA